jgi:hypothetical protein
MISRGDRTVGCGRRCDRGRGVETLEPPHVLAQDYASPVQQPAVSGYLGGRHAKALDNAIVSYVLSHPRVRCYSVGQDEVWRREGRIQRDAAMVCAAAVVFRSGE